MIELFDDSCSCDDFQLSFTPRLSVESMSFQCSNGGGEEALKPMLYADDPVLIGESKEEVKDRYRIWKRKLHCKGLCVKVRKTKMFVVDSENKASEDRSLQVM